MSGGELWRTSWPGNPPTKKNTPLPLTFCLCGDGKKRQIGAFLDRLKSAAANNSQRWDALLRELADGTAAENGIGFKLAAEAADALAADLEAVTGDGGRQIIILPEESFRKAMKEVVPHLRREWGERPALGGKDQPLAIEAHFYLGPKQRPDLLSLCEAVSDLLQEAGVIVNDSWIASWDGTRRHKDQRGNPRTEVIIREFVAETRIYRESPTAPGLFDDQPAPVTATP